MNLCDIRTACLMAAAMLASVAAAQFIAPRPPVRPTDATSGLPNESSKRIDPKDSSGKSIGQVNGLAVNRDGTILALGTSEGKIRLWQVEPAKELAVLEFPAPASQPASAPATQASETVVYVPRKVPGAAEVCWDAKQNVLAALADDRVLIWDLPARKLVATLPVVSPRRIEISADGKELTVISDEKTALKWALADHGVPANAKPTSKDYTRPATRAAFAFPGSYMLNGPAIEDPYGEYYAASYNMRGPQKYRPGLFLTLYDGLSHQQIIEFQVGYGEIDPTPEIRFSPNGRFLAAAAENGNTLALSDLGLPGTNKLLGGHSAFVTALGFSGDSKLLVSADASGTVFFWPLKPATSSPQNLTTIWDSMSRSLYGTASVNVWTMAGGGDKTVEFIRNQLFPTCDVDPAVFQKLVADLDSDAFKVRKAAYEKLDKMGDGLWPLLKDARGKAKSAEVRNAMDTLMSKISRPSASQEMYGVLVLERILTPQALALLKQMAADASPETASIAKAALEKPIVRQALAERPEGATTAPATTPATLPSTAPAASPSPAEPPDRLSK